MFDIVSNETLNASDSIQSTTRSDDLVKQWLKKQDILRENINNVCEKYGQDLKKPVGKSNLIWDQKHKLLYCRNAKVAS